MRPWIPRHRPPADDRPTLRDRGASALEWAIIAAVTVLMVSVIGGVIYNIVDAKSEKLQDCADQPVGSACPNTGGQ